jgi:hypothetical protein
LQSDLESTNELKAFIEDNCQVQSSKQSLVLAAISEQMEQHLRAQAESKQWCQLYDHKYFELCT